MINSMEIIRCSYTYLHQEIENAEILMKMMNELDKGMWNGIKNGLLNYETIKNLEERANAMNSCIGKIKAYNKDIEDAVRQIIAEEQIRMNYRK